MYRRLVPLAVGVAVLFVLAGASSASAASVWWHVTSGARPKYLKTGYAENEVRTVTVNATGGTFQLARQGPVTGLIPFNASAAEVQASLEEIFGANVTVTGGPVGHPAKVENEPYRVEFVNALNRTPVQVFNGVGTHLTGTVTTARISEGRTDGELVASAYNLGDATASGEKSPIVVTDMLPAGVEAVVASAVQPEHNVISNFPCEVKPGGHVVVCTDQNSAVAPYSALEVRIAVEVQPVVSGENQVSVAGGEGQFCEPVAETTGKYRDGSCAEYIEEGGNFELRSSPLASASLPAGRGKLIVSNAETPFGVEEYEMADEQEGGVADTQAGSHQFQTTFSVALNQGPDRNLPPSEENSGKPLVEPAQLPKNLNFALPPGWIGNPSAFPKCPTAAFLNDIISDFDECPPDTAMGAVDIHVPTELAGTYTLVVPLFNLEPRPGEPARLGFFDPTSQQAIYIDTSVRTGGDYAIVSEVHNISQYSPPLSSEVTVWGVPGDPSHDSSRGWACLAHARGQGYAGPCSTVNEQHPPAFLSLPTSCQKSPLSGEPEPLQSTVTGTSWAEPLREEELATAILPALHGCNRLPFAPSIKVKADGEAASSSTGIKVDVHVPQEETLNSAGLAESAVKQITVALPPGVQVNPSGGDGLEACTGNPAALSAGEFGSPGDQVGFTGLEDLGSEGGASTATFTPRLPGSFGTEDSGEEATLKPGINFCSNAAKIGTVKIKTPILPNTIEGAVYLANQNQNPFGSLIALYLVAEDPVSGVLVKAAGQVSLCHAGGEVIDGKTCEVPGQLISTFENPVQAPFEDAELEFFGGERAPLATPADCGSYTTTASLAPWSGNEAVPSSATFNITSGPNHSACTYPGQALPFHPFLTGGATNLNAGIFSPLTGTFGREDGEQNVSGAQFHIPPGLSGILSSVKLCPEAQANAGTCGPESLVGETTVSAGVGPDPVYVKGGKVYITEKYHGAPFGVSIVNSVKAGPFDLEHDTANPNQDPACDCIVVRARIEIDPYTTALTITTNNENEGYSIPHFIDGIPVQIKKVNFITTRAGFQFNPTNCSPMQMSATIYSDEGASDNVAVPFQVTNCALLKFEPKFQVSTAPAKDTRLDGATLTAKLAYPSAPQGTQTNIASVKVELPKGLPSRLNTLRRACTAAQFNANPAGCPSASKIGMVVVHTPVLPVPLTGPAIFVSHGGEAWPTLTLVLQGDGVTVDLVGTTLISKAGVTSTTFKTVPDQPFSTFELTLPQGEYSALTTLGNLCKQKPVMPTEFLAQNGAQLKTDTKIEVQGCGKAKKKVRHKRKRTHHKKRNNDKRSKK